MVTDVPEEVMTKRLQEMIQLWQKYMEIFNRGLDSETVSAEDEKEFRNLQMDITRRAQYLTYALPNNLFDLWKDMKKVLTQTPSLFILKQEVGIRITNFRALWHEVSISLNQKQGHLRSIIEEREQKKVSKKK